MFTRYDLGLNRMRYETSHDLPAVQLLSALRRQSQELAQPSQRLLIREARPVSQRQADRRYRKRALR
jgi:hypothetical protein